MGLEDLGYSSMLYSDNNGNGIADTVDSDDVIGIVERRGVVDTTNLFEAVGIVDRDCWVLDSWNPTAYCNMNTSIIPHLYL